MSNLFKLRGWLTIPDAARHLSIVLDEEVRECDVLRLALDDHLAMSVLFVNAAFARPCVPVKPDEILYDEVTSLDGVTQLKLPKHGRCWGDWRGNFQVASNFVTELTGVWDLPLTDGGRADVEYLYHNLIGNPELGIVTLEGLLVQDSRGALYELQSSFKDNPYFKGQLKAPYNHPENFHPAGGLPNDAVLVVRTAALRDFEAKISGEVEPDQKPLSTTERNTLLVLIGALCKNAAIDPVARTAAGQLQQLVRAIGGEMDDGTIRDKLRQIPEAIRAKSK